MCRQSVVTDLWFIYQPALHHIPAQYTLCHQQNKKRQHFIIELPIKSFSDGKIEPGQKHKQSYHTAKHPMRVFPEENRLEFRKSHMVIELLIFRVGFIHLKNFVPVSTVDGGEYAH